MSVVPRLAALLTCWLAVAPVSGALGGQDDGARDGGRSAAQALERQRAYLDRSPYNEVVFEQLLETVANSGGLGGLIGEYRAREEADEDDDAARVVLARLLARSGELEQAERLLGRAEPCTELTFLRARLALERAEFGQALERLDELTELADADLVRERAQLEGRAYLGQGERERAAAALLAPARASDDRGEALDAALILERYGLIDDAAQAYGLALERAADDPEARSATLVALGNLEARRFGLAAAIEAYRAADELLGRAHWRKPELSARLVDWHQRAGRLEEWIGTLRNRAEAEPRDVALREAWARALARAQRYEDALEALAPAIEDLPADRALSKLRLDWLVALEDDDALLVELQRITAQRPEDRNLGVQLAVRLARAGRVAAADARFAALFQTHPDDVELRRAAAHAWSAGGEPERAASALEACVELAPLDLALVRELVLVLDGDQLHARAARALAAARARIRAPTALVVELAQVHVTLGRPDAARAMLLELLKGDPEAHEGRLLLAEMELGADRRAQARQLLRAVIGGARSARLRSIAANEYLETFHDRKERVDELRREQDNLERWPADVATPLVLERLHTSLSNHADATRMLARAIEQRPDDIALREDLVRRWRRLANWPEILEQLRELEQRAPERARLYRTQRIDVLRRLGRRDDALTLIATLEEGSRRAPSAACDLVGAYLDLDAAPRALALVESVLGRYPRNVDLLRALADVQHALGRERDAAHTLVRAYRGASADHRDEIQAQLAGGLQRAREQSTATGFLAEFEKEVDDNPFDLPGRRLLIGLFLRRRDHDGATRQLDRLLDAQPDDLEGLGLRARLARSQGRHADAVRDFERLREIDRGFAGELDLLDSYLQVDASEAAFTLAVQIDDPLVAARLLVEHGHAERAVELLVQRLAGRRGSAAEWRWLAETRRKLGDVDGALHAFEEVELAGGAGVDVFLALAELRYDQGDLERCLNAVRSLLRDPAGGSVAQAFLGDRRMWSTYDELLAENVVRAPLDEALIARALDVLEARPHLEAGRAALGALETVRAQTLARGRYPAGHTETTWRTRLHDWELGVRLRHARLAAEALHALRTELTGGARATSDAWADFAILLRRTHGLVESDWALLEAGRAQCGDALRFAAALAELAESELDPARAVVYLDELLRAWDDERESRERAEAHALERERLRARLEALGFEYEEAELEQAARFLTTYAGVELGPHLSAPTRAMLARRSGLQLARAGALAEARARLAAATPAADAAQVEWTRHLAALARARGLAAEWQESRAAFERCQESSWTRAVAALSERAPLPVQATHQPQPDFAAAVVWRYDRARDDEDAGACMELVLGDAQAPVLRAAHEARAEAALVRLRAAGDAPSAEQVLDAYTAWVRLAELLGWEDRPVDATRAWVRAASFVRAPAEALTEASLAARRAGDTQLAASLMTRALAAHGTAHPALPRALPFRALRRIESELAMIRRWSLAKVREVVAPEDPIVEELLLVSVLLESGDHGAAARVLEGMSTERELPWDVAWGLWGLVLAEIEVALPSPHERDLLRGFLRQQPTHWRAQALYIERLLDDGEHTEARRALERCALLRFPNLEEAERLLDPLTRRLEEVALEPVR